MELHGKYKFFAAGLLLWLAACSMAGETAEAQAPMLFAEVNELSGDVALRHSSADDFFEAALGTILQKNGEMKTGESGRARLDLTDGTVIRVGPSSMLILAELKGEPENMSTQITMGFGQLWAVLRGESLEIITSRGLATVRGSYLGVYSKEGSDVIMVNCFEGDCSVRNNAGSIEIVAGQSATLGEEDVLPEQGVISETDMNEWIALNPEAGAVLPTIIQTVAAWQTLTPPPPTSEPGDGGDTGNTGEDMVTGEIVIRMFEAETVTITSGISITLTMGWGGDTVGHVQAFYDLAPYTAYLDGEALPESGASYSEITGGYDLDEDGDEDYGGYFEYDLGTLSPGTYVVTVSAPAHSLLLDGLTPDGCGEGCTGPHSFSVTVVVTE